MLYAVVLGLFLYWVRIDPPKFYMLTGREQEAKIAIQKIYHTNGDPLKINNIYTFLKKTSGETTVEISMKDALWDNERYVRASWIAIFIMMA